MRKILFYVFSLLMLIACDAGGNTRDGGSEYLNVRDIEIPGGNTTATMAIEASNNCDWIVSWSDTWIRSISPTTGRGSQNVTITITTNPSPTATRTASVTVSNTNGNITRNVTLTQSPNSEQINIQPEELNFTSEGGSQTVAITSNTQWTVEGGADWIESISPKTGDGNGSITIKTKENLTEDSHETTLTLRGSEGISVPLKVAQSGMAAQLSVSPTTISATATAGSYQIAIESNVAWTAHSNQSWATLSEIAGTGSKTLTVSVADNTSQAAQEADITVSYSTNKQEVVHIRQAEGEKPVIGSLREADITNVTKTEATVSFSFQSIFDVTEYGVCYSSVNSSPTTSDQHLSRSAMEKQGSVSFLLTGLTKGATYYVRTYAVSAVGTQYSNSISFTTISGWPGEDDNVTPN